MTTRTGKGNPDRGAPMSHSAEIEELRRRLDSMVRVGVVEEADYERNLFRVRLGENLLTDWLRVGSERAGTTNFSRQLSIGEQVSVQAPSGRLEQAFIGWSINTIGAPGPSQSEEIYRFIYPDGAVTEYDHVNHRGSVSTGETSIAYSREEVSLTVGNTTIEIRDGSIKLLVNGKGVEIGSGVSVTGSSLDHLGKNVGSDHKHSGVTSGSSTTQGPV